MQVNLNIGNFDNKITINAEEEIKFIIKEWIIKQKRSPDMYDIILNISSVIFDFSLEVTISSDYDVIEPLANSIETNIYQPASFQSVFIWPFIEYDFKTSKLIIYAIHARNFCIILGEQSRKNLARCLREIKKTYEHVKKYSLCLQEFNDKCKLIKN